MVSTVEIVNLALLDLGQKTISSLGDNKKTARIASGRYGAVVDATLRAHPWNCAQRRVALAAEVTAPVFGPANSYVRLPEDLRVLEVEDGQLYKWRIEQRRIVSDQAAPLRVRYIARITDPNEFDTLLIEAIAARLAWSMAMPLTLKPAVAAQMKQNYIDKLAEARGVDGQEGSTRKSRATEWLESRRSGVGDPFGGEDPWV